MNKLIFFVVSPLLIHTITLRHKGNPGEKASDMMMSGSVANLAIRSEEILLGFRNIGLLGRRQWCKMRRGNFEDPYFSSTVKEEGVCEGSEL